MWDDIAFIRVSRASANFEVVLMRGCRKTQSCRYWSRVSLSLGFAWAVLMLYR